MVRGKRSALAQIARKANVTHQAVTYWLKGWTKDSPEIEAAVYAVLGIEREPAEVA